MLPKSEAKNLLHIFPKPDERAFFLGMTGSGKTTLAVSMLKVLSGRTQVDVLDTKVEPAFEEIPGAEIIERFRQVKNSTAPVRIYRPVPDEALDYKQLDEYLRWRYEDYPGLTYVDELLSLGAQSKPLPGFLQLLTRGRSRQAAFWYATQRPAWVSRFAFSEANRFYVFRLNDRRDRDAVAGFSSPRLRNPPQEKFGFWYYSINGLKAKQFKALTRKEA